MQPFRYLKVISLSEGKKPLQYESFQHVWKLYVSLHENLKKMVGVSTKGNIQWEVTTFNSKKKKFSGINESSSLKVSPISKVLKFAFRGRDQNLFSREWWGTRWRWGSKITDSKESHHWWGKTRFIQSEGVCSVATSRLPEQGAHSPGAQTGVYTSPYNSVRWMR